MSDVLQRICKDKREHVQVCRQKLPLEEIRTRLAEAPPVRGFAQSLAEKTNHSMGIIAEMKRGSPSGGLIRANFDPAEIALDYEAGGAACLSVLTDTPHFLGVDTDLVTARAACALPVLRKDFMIDAYQIYESRLLGADCILIIVAALDQGEAHDLAALAQELNMDVLVEVHNEQEMERAHALPASLIGINNRNLKTLVTDIETTARLLPLAPAGIPVVSESGLKSAAEIQRLSATGVKRFLIGESLLRQHNLQKAVSDLVQAS